VPGSNGSGGPSWGDSSKAEHCSCTAGIGVRVPVAPPGRAEIGGLSACNANPSHRSNLFVRRFAAEARSAAPELRSGRGAAGPPQSWDRSSLGRAPARHAGGSRFDSGRFHHVSRLSRCKGPDSGAPAWYAGDGGCNSRVQLRVSSRGHLPTVKMAGSHPADAGSTPAARSGLSCGGSSTVECERAKLATGVRFPSTALWSRLKCSVTLTFTRVSPNGRATGLHPVDAGSTPAARSPSRFSGEERGLQNRGSGFDSRSALQLSLLIALEAERKGGRLLNGSKRVRLPPGALSIDVSAHLGAWLSLEERLSGGQEIAGSNPAAPTAISRQSSPSARWPRHPDSQSGNAGSTPAGDTGPPRRPARLSKAGASTVEPTNHIGRAAPSSRGPAILSPSWRLQAPCYERGCRGSTPRGEAISRPCPGGTRREPPKLAVPGSTPGRGSAGRDRLRRGSYPRCCRCNSYPCNRDDPRREAALIRLSARVRLPPSRPSGCGSIW
jgi:hypothetical protein